MILPGLAKGNAAVQQLWIERLTAELLGDQVDGDEFRAHILAGAVMGVINAAMIDWYRSPDATRLVDLVGRGLDIIDPILEYP